MTCSKKSCKCKCRKAEEREQKNRQDFNNLESLLMNAVKIKRLTGKHPELDGFFDGRDQQVGRATNARCEDRH